MYHFLPELPEVSRDVSDIDKLQTTLLGNDLEWNQKNEPTILGLSDGNLTISVPFDDGLDQFKELAVRTDIDWVGHNIVGADLLVLSKLGIEIPLERIQDTIIYHWLVNMHLCKASGKSALEEDADEKRGRGFMNLWTMLSIYTNLWHYKNCRDKKGKKGAISAPVFCDGPCPDHDKYGYNGVDSLGPVLALPALKRQAMLRGVDKLYPMHRELMWELAKIREAGVRVDVPFVYPRAKHPLGSSDGISLDEQFLQEKDDIAKLLPFNPSSNPQVIEFFKTKGVELENNQEETIRDAVEDLEDGAPEELVLLLDFKELGNGVDRWYAPQYRDKDGWIKGYLDIAGYIHPRTAPFTSSARLMQSSPNLQNAGKRRKSRSVCTCTHNILAHVKGNCSQCSCLIFIGESIGKRVRRAIIAPEGYYIVRADLSNAEGRTILYHAGYREVPGDIHSWMVKNIGLTEDEPFSKALGGAREAAKSVVHASNYLEGLQLKEKNDLRSPRMKQEVNAGARVIFWDWTFKGKIVTFTGINLARRVFGDASFENRKKALDAMTRYIDQSFPKIRDFHKKVSKQVEVEHAVRTLHGYVKLSYDPNPNDELKTAVAIWGQQTTAHLNKLAILDVQRKFNAGRPMRAVMPLHDELITYTHQSVSPREAAAWIKESMELSLPEMPGLEIPADPSYGQNWRDQKKI